MVVVRIVPASFVGSLSSTESGGRLGKKEPGVSGDLRSVFLKCDKPSPQMSPNQRAKE